MKPEEFNVLVDQYLGQCRDVLDAKNPEYSSTDDRLHNFKVAAQLQCETPRQALMGMFAKHVVSLFDMGNSTKKYTDAQWDAKLIDTINYSLLLKGILEDEKRNPLQLRLQTIVPEMQTFVDHLTRKGQPE